MDNLITSCLMLVLLLGGSACSFTLPDGDPTPSEVHERVADVVTTEWNRHPALERMTDQCYAERDHIRIWIIEGDAFQQFCGVPSCGPDGPHPCYAGCFRYIWNDPHSFATFFETFHPGIVVVPRYELPALAHELLHWLSGCVTGAADSNHDDPDVWDGPDSVRGRTSAEWDRLYGSELVL